MKQSVFNQYLIFNKFIYPFYTSFNTEFIKKTKTNHFYINGGNTERIKQRKTKAYNKIYLKKAPTFPIKRSIRQKKINNLML